jgi:hypothetical protein
MRECPSGRLNTTVIPCFIVALQRVFSRHLISGYPRETGEINKKNQTLERRFAVYEKFFPPPPTPRARRREERSGEIIVVRGN